MLGLKARCFAVTGKNLPALDLYVQALELAPDRPTIYAELASLLVEREEELRDTTVIEEKFQTTSHHIAAAGILDRMVENNKESAEAYRFRGQWRLEGGLRPVAGYETGCCEENLFVRRRTCADHVMDSINAVVTKST